MQSDSQTESNMIQPHTVLANLASADTTKGAHL